MLTLEWMRVEGSELERNSSYLVRWGRLIYNFTSHNTKVAYFSGMGYWLVEGKAVKVPDYVIPLNLMKHVAAPEAFSIGDRVHINDPKTQHWTGTVVAKRNLPGIWVIRNSVDFATDVSEGYLTRATLQTPPSSS